MFCLVPKVSPSVLPPTTRALVAVASDSVPKAVALSIESNVENKNQSYKFQSF